MDNLIFCLNVTVPIFLTLLLGYFFRRIGLFDETFVNRMNKFVFVIPLPVLLFQDIAKIDIYEAWDPKMVLFCFAITSLSIMISVLLSRFLHPSDIRGEFIQASYRSSAAILGIAIIQNLYGNAGMAPLMIIASVPLYNVMAVVVLSVFKPGQGKIDGTVLKRTLKGIVSALQPVHSGPFFVFHFRRSWTLRQAILQKPPLLLASWLWADLCTSEKPFPG